MDEGQKTNRESERGNEEQYSTEEGRAGPAFLPSEGQSGLFNEDRDRDGWMDR